MSSNTRVSFKPAPVYSRLPHDDEAYVMRAFSRHAGHCQQCADPYVVHRRGGSLCARGHRRALDVAQYVYNRHGQAYSVVDREGYQRVQIEIPTNCEAVRSLLKAMERGLRLSKQDEEKTKSSGPKSYDRTYYVTPRPVTVHQSSSSQHAQPASKRSYYKASAPSPTSSFSSESSFERDSTFTRTVPVARSSSSSSHKAHKSRPQVYYRPSADAEPVPVQDKYYWK